MREIGFLSAVYLGGAFWLVLLNKIMGAPPKRLKGRERLIEISGGILALLSFFRCQDFRAALTVFLFFSLLFLTALWDGETMEIPNRFPLALLFPAFLSYFIGARPQMDVKEMLIGALCVSFPMFLIAFFLRGAFGGGDIKLMAAGGFFLGGAEDSACLYRSSFYSGDLLCLSFNGKKGEREAYVSLRPFSVRRYADCRAVGLRLGPKTHASFKSNRFS